MMDASYTDPRLAAVYDTLNPPAIEDRFHLDLAGAAPCSVLDVGCGTGRIASAFAARNAAVAEWKTWTPELTHERLDVPGAGVVEVHNAIRSVEGPRVTFETHFRFAPDETVVTASTLRFMTQDEVAGFLAESGLNDVTWHGDWDLSPFGPASPEIITIARA